IYKERGFRHDQADHSPIAIGQRADAARGKSPVLERDLAHGWTSALWARRSRGHSQTRDKRATTSAATPASHHRRTNAAAKTTVSAMAHPNGRMASSGIFKITSGSASTDELAIISLP